MSHQDKAGFQSHWKGAGNNVIQEGQQELVDALPLIREPFGGSLGQDGFGFLPSRDGPPLKVPQLGRVLIEDNVEVGAATAIDRGTIGDTVVGEGTRIDNHVHIAHNVRIGRWCLIAAQVGIAGGATIGERVVIGGQTAIRDHVKVGAGAQIGGASAVYRDIPAGTKWAVSPAQPLQHWLRARSREMKRTAGPQSKP